MLAVILALDEKENMSYILRAIALIGIIVFGSSFVFTYSMPGFVEQIGKDFIKKEIQDRTNEKIESFSLNFSQSNNAFVKFASKLAEKNEKKIDDLKEKLKEKSHLKLAATIAEMSNLNCECRKKYEKYFEKGTKNRIFSLESANTYLHDFTRTKYMEVTNNLKTDLRIFTGSNLIVFLFVLLISFIKPKARIHLVLPSALLVASSLVCSYFYIFNQNWFFTILYSSYLGWWYLAYLGIVFALLCDIAFNKGKITTKTLNALLNIVGSAASAIVPC